MFESTDADCSDSLIDPGEYDRWTYRGECYFSSSEINALLEGKLEKGTLFQKLTDEISGIERIFRPRYNFESDMWNWSVTVLTETGAKQIVFGIERTTDSIDRSAIRSSKLIEVIELECDLYDM